MEVIMVLKSKLLRDKDAKGIKELKLLAFEYMVTDISIKHCEIENLKDIEDFNQKNRFLKETLTSFGFFVSTATEYTESLYNLFGAFSYKHYGPSADDLNEIIDEVSPHYYHFGGHEERHKVSVLPIPNVAGFNELRNKIAQEKIEFENGSIKFKNILIEDDQGDDVNFLYKTIDNAVNTIHEQSNKFLFRGNISDIRRIANFFPSFKEKRSQIDYLDCKPERRPYFANEMI